MGMGAERYDVNLFETMQIVLFMSMSRVSVGEPLCHEKGYLDTQSLLVKIMGACGVLVGQLTPPMFKPILGYMAAVPIYFLKRRVSGYLIPTIQELMEHMERKRGNPGYVYEEPQDMITWMIAAILDGKDERAKEPEVLAMHIMFFLCRPHANSVHLIHTLFRISAPNGKHAFHVPRN